MDAKLGPTRPDRLTIWPVETGGFGIDVRWGGPPGLRRATVVRDQLAGSGTRAQLKQELDGGWVVRLGPVPAAEVGAVIDGFVW